MHRALSVVSDLTVCRMGFALVLIIKTGSNSGAFMIKRRGQVELSEPWSTKTLSFIDLESLVSATRVTMIELLIALGIFILLVIVAVGGEFIHWRLLLLGGVSLVGLGFGAGILTGLLYHLALHKALARRGLLGARWWWRPTSYNDRIPPGSRRKVMGWFYAGVTSMVVILVGCALVLAALIMVRNQ